MGSTLSYFNANFEKFCTTKIEKDDPILANLFLNDGNLDEIYAYFSCEIAYKLVKEHPENYKFLVRLCLNKLMDALSTSDFFPMQLRTVGVVLSRLVTVSHYDDVRETVKDFFFDGGDDVNAHLATKIVKTAAMILFLPGFTISSRISMEEKNFQALAWEKGIFVESKRLKAPPHAMEHRSVFLRLLLTCYSDAMYSYDTWSTLEFDIPHMGALFVSTFNTLTIFKQPGFMKRLFVSDTFELLAETCLHTLILFWERFPHADSPNSYPLIYTTITRFFKIFPHASKILFHLFLLKYPQFSIDIVTMVDVPNLVMMLMDDLDSIAGYILLHLSQHRMFGLQLQDHSSEIVIPCIAHITKNLDEGVTVMLILMLGNISYQFRNLDQRASHALMKMYHFYESKFLKNSEDVLRIIRNVLDYQPSKNPSFVYALLQHKFDSEHLNTCKEALRAELAPIINDGVAPKKIIKHVADMSFAGLFPRAEPVLTKTLVMTEEAIEWLNTFLLGSIFMGQQAVLLWDGVYISRFAVTVLDEDSKEEEGIVAMPTPEEPKEEVQEVQEEEEEEEEPAVEDTVSDTVEEVLEEKSKRD
ncbi:hypothetical protein PCE1_003923 [Barthelona sp. PCE]